MNVIKSPLSTVNDIIEEMKSLRGRPDSYSGMWGALKRLGNEMSFVADSDRTSLVFEIAKMLAWEEVGLDPTDRSLKTFVLKILAKYGDEGVVRMIETFENNMRNFLYEGLEGQSTRSWELREWDREAARTANETPRSKLRGIG